MNVLNGLSNTAVKAISAGVIGGLGAKYVLGVDGYLDIMGMNIDSFLVYALVVGGASGINEATKNFTLPMLGISNPLSQSAVMIASPAISGATTLGLGYIINGMELPSKSGAIQGFLLGALSDIGANYIVDISKNYQME